MFNKILIANRGAIACKIIKICKKLNIKTVAVYSKIDKNSLHVKCADEAFCIRNNIFYNNNYLNIASIIEIAKKNNVDAIHPGYGFLSENPLFAKSCENENITFIGPNYDSMKIMASKQYSKQILQNINIPLIPGYHGNNQKEIYLFNQACKIGFPNLLKAAYGGGGRGIYTVHKQSDFFKVFNIIKNEAKLNRFFNKNIIIEKIINESRHIEIQIASDKYGNIIHLFGRDCSIQRRSQKIIEEAPIINISSRILKKLVKISKAIVKFTKYIGLGSIEFLIDKNSKFYFLEMNTRLQVEYFITEIITGIDLISLQIKIAYGKPIQYKQKYIKYNGHAIECRIYAEDPISFIPSTGKISFVNLPMNTSNLYINSSIRKNTIINRYYDPMISQLIVWEKNRHQAIKRMQYVLSNYMIGGIKTNLPILLNIFKNYKFISGHANINFLERHLWLPNVDEKKIVFMAASYNYLKLTNKLKDPLLRRNFFWKIDSNKYFYYTFLFENKNIEVKIFPIGIYKFKSFYKNKEYIIRAKLIFNKLIIYYNNCIQKSFIENKHEKIILYLQDGKFSIKNFDWSYINNIKHNITNHIQAPVTSAIVSIMKQLGEIVKIGTPILILESMKIQYTICANKNGIIKKFFYNVGDIVKKGSILLIIN